MDVPDDIFKERNEHMGLLNKSNKTKTILTIGDISKKVSIGIVGTEEWNMTPKQKAYCDLLIDRVKNLETYVLWEEWTIDNVPTLGLKYENKLTVIGHTYRKQYIFFICTTNPDGSTTTYKVSISFNRRKIDDMQLREYQQGHIKNGKWYSEIVSGNFKKYNHGTSK